jgi:hypothetical protein
MISRKVLRDVRFQNWTRHDAERRRLQLITRSGPAHLTSPMANLAQRVAGRRLNLGPARGRLWMSVLQQVPKAGPSA